MTGSTRVARHAGTRLASSATTVSVMPRRPRTSPDPPRHAVQQRSHQARHDEREAEAKHDADERERDAAAEHEPHHLAAAGADRHADPDLARAAADTYDSTP